MGAQPVHDREALPHLVVFALDLFSILTSLFDVLGDENTEDFKALRAVRALRLVKLIKLARGSRIFKRWEMRISINYSYLTLFGITTGIVISCHWVACIWGMQATFQPLNSWLYSKGYCVEWGVAQRARRRVRSQQRVERAAAAKLLQRGEEPAVVEHRTVWAEGATKHGVQRASLGL